MADLPSQDTRLCFLGDSLTHGVGDPDGLGWPGRLAAAARAEGCDLTAYNLGVRMDTGADLVRRLPEVRARLRHGDRYGLVLSFGVNDTAAGTPGGTDQSLRAVEQLLSQAQDNGWAALVVGAPPVADPTHDRRVATLSGAMGELCATRAVDHVSSHDLLRGDAVWHQAMVGGDGFHPTAAGYDRWADLLRPAFLRWLATGGA